MLWPSQMVLMVKNPSLGGDHPEEEEMATHSSTLSLKGQRSLEGYSPWDRKKSDMTEQLTLSLASGCLQVIHHPKHLAQLTCFSGCEGSGKPQTPTTHWVPHCAPYAGAT